MTRVLITGVRGKTGVPLAEQLVARGVDVLGGSSDPSRVHQPGVRPVRFAWDDPSSWPDAVDGVDAIYLVRPDIAPAPDLIADVMAATPAHVRVTLLSERRTDTFPAGHWARRAEDAVTSSTHPWTILRPSWFMQVLTDPRFYVDDLAAGRLPFPGADATVAWIDARDIAAVAASTLLDAAHDGRVHELTGPQSLSLRETAQIIGTALGHDVRHEELSVAEAVTGMTGFERTQAAETFERVLAGEFAAVTADVEDVTGRAASSLAQFLTEAVTPGL